MTMAMCILSHFEPLSILKFRAALELIQIINTLYHEILIRVGNIIHDLLSIGSILPDNDIDFELEISDKLESESTPFRAYRHAANKSFVVSNKNLLGLDPGQDQKTKYILFDENCEEFPFPIFFFKPKFGYNFSR